MEIARGAAIVVIDKKIVFIKRRKINKITKSIEEFYVIPGGQQDEGETIEQTTIREIKEELSLDISLRTLYYKENYQGQDKYYFLSNIVSGQLKEGEGPEFHQKEGDFEKYGSFEIVLLDKNDIKEKNVVPKVIKEMLIKDYSKLVNN